MSAGEHLALSGGWLTSDRNHKKQPGSSFIGHLVDRLMTHPPPPQKNERILDSDCARQVFELKAASSTERKLFEMFILTLTIVNHLGLLRQ